MTKRSFAITASLMTQIWGPTTIRISGDETVAGQIEATPDGGVQFNFPERIVLIANHQVCPSIAKLARKITNCALDLHRLGVSLVGRLW